LHTLKRLKDE